MKKYTILFMLIFFNLTYSQSSAKDTLYLYIENPKIAVDIDGNYSYVLIIPSNDKRFKCDSFKFSIFSQKDFDSKFKLPELITTVNKRKINESKIISGTSLMSRNPYNLHEDLSIYKNIYLITKNSNDNRSYSLIKLDYAGTQKNFVPSAIQECKF